MAMSRWADRLRIVQDRNGAAIAVGDQSYRRDL